LVGPLNGAVVETNQFLSKSLDKPAKPTNFISTNIGPISLHKFATYSFRCALNNPSVDSRVYRIASPGDENQTPWLICKQLKHSNSNKAKMSITEVIKAYHKWEARMVGFYDSYRCIYVLITNRSIDQEDLKSFQQMENYRYCAVVCKENFGEYCTSSFSLYSIFDDDTNQQAQEMNFGEIKDIFPNDLMSIVID